MQKKTFTKWVNSHLARVGCHIGDLYADLRDGFVLTRLLEVLSGEQLVRGPEGPGEGAGPGVTGWAIMGPSFGWAGLWHRGAAWMWGAWGVRMEMEAGF